MKKIQLLNKILFFLFLNFPLCYSQTVDQVVIQYEDMRCQQDRWQEWECEIYSYLYKNGQPVEHNENYTYTWYCKRKNETQFKIDSISTGTGIKHSHRYEDGEYNKHFDNYLTVEGPDFFVVSDVIDVGQNGSAHKVNLIAKSQENTNLILNEYFREFTDPHWRSFGSNVDVYFFLNKNRTLWTDINVIDEINEKYYEWDVENTPLINYHDFIISEYINNIIAKTRKVCTATLKSKVISGGVSICLGFKDPWYADGAELGGIKRNRGKNALWYDYENIDITLDNNDSHKGVFKDLDPGVDPDYVYSLRAIKNKILTVHDNEQVDFFFTNWQTNSRATITQPTHTETIDNVVYYTSPVIFHDNNAQVIAEFKGHLASSVARATGYNNGRRIAKSGNTLYLVYEDNGEIWYTYSTDNGQTWAKETRISAKKYTDSHGIEHSFIHPSIAAEADGTVYVVFECQLKQGSTTDTYILFRKKDSAWDNIRTVSKGHYNSYGWWTDYQDHDDSYPAITAGGSGVFVAYHSVTDDYHQYKSIKMRQYLSGGEWSLETKLSSASGLPVIGNLSGTYKIALVWPQNGRIKYRAAYTYYNDEKEGWDWHWASEYDLSNFCPGLFDEHNAPSIAIDANNHGYMAWLASDQEMDEQNLLYQKFNFGASPSSASSVYSLDFNEDYLIESPSISFESGTNYVTVFYQYHDNIYRKRLSGSSWYFHNYNAGKYPGISSNAATGAVWTKYTSAPYLLQTENLQSHLAKVTSSELSAYKRFYFPTQSDSSYLITDLTTFECNGRALHFYDGLNSDTLQADQPLTFTYHLEFNRAQAGKWLRFWFVSGDQKYLLDQVELTGEEKENSLDRSVNFDAGKAQEGYVQIDFPESQPFVINVVPEDNSGSGLAKATVAPAANPFVPKTFRLNQNFPNPFNPTTQIVFDLPREANIRLEVFDISGHKIATLAEGQKAAGRYHVVFEGKNLASGVYIYRLTTDKGFVQSKKMMLIR